MSKNPMELYLEETLRRMDKALKEIPGAVELPSPANNNQRANDAGNKYDGGKLRMDLVPVRSLERVAAVLTYGAQKYDDRNWEKGITWSRCYGAALRHLLAWWGGEDIDQESGLPHLAHAATNLFFLMEFACTHTEKDDRPHVGQEASNCRTATEVVAAGNPGR